MNSPQGEVDAISDSGLLCEEEAPPPAKTKSESDFEDFLLMLQAQSEEEGEEDVAPLPPLSLSRSLHVGRATEMMFPAEARSPAEEAKRRASAPALRRPSALFRFEGRLRAKADEGSQRALAVDVDAPRATLHNDEVFTRVDSASPTTAGMAEASAARVDPPPPVREEPSFQNGHGPSAFGQEGRTPSSADERVDANSTDSTGSDHPCGEPKVRVSSNGSAIGAVQVDEQAPQLNRLFFRGLECLSFRRRRREGRRGRGGRRRMGRAGSSMGDSEAGTSAGRGRGGRRRMGRAGSSMDDPEAGTSASSRRGSGRSVRVGDEPSVAIDAEVQRPAMDEEAGLSVSETAPGAIVQRLESSGEYLVNAVRVMDVEAGEVEGEVVIAEELSFYQRKSKAIGMAMCLLVLAMIALLCGFLATGEEGEAPQKVYIASSDAPSDTPSMQPSFDPRPTLQILQERGKVRCGRGSWSMMGAQGDLYMDMCRSIAAVVLGDSEGIEEVIVTASNRFEKLHGGEVDLLLYGDTHTVEREVREPTTGAGFSFSSPYYYDGLSYYGEEMYVECAEERRRFMDCSSLRICTDETTGLPFLKASFPSDFIVVSLSLEGMLERIKDGRCNVMIGNKKSLLLNIAETHASDGTFVLGEKLLTKEPSAVVTRDDDREFSNVVEWVVQALFFGEERGLARSPSLCRTRADSPGGAADLDFLNAVYCVGNYKEISRDGDNRGMNLINDGTTGMIYPIPFGELEQEDDDLDVLGKTILHEIRNNGTLNCGVIVPDGFDGAEDRATVKELFNMTIDYCKTVAAAMFNGNFYSVNLQFFLESEDESFLALNNGTIDVLSGVTIKKKHYFKSSPSLGGFRFSTPYYYGKEAGGATSFYSLATRDNDAMLSSFINLVVSVLFYALEKNLVKENTVDVPLVSLFGSEFAWSLRDAVDYSGNYNQLYKKHFGGEPIGRNTPNGGSPRILSFPGLSH